ncbi:hypothetical protein GQ600_751 [Phytophthora cactorum]|nr:hypothetical protein GQ600_751 [Phytophthora cactorum]
MHSSCSGTRSRWVSLSPPTPSPTSGDQTSKPLTSHSSSGIVTAGWCSSTRTHGRPTTRTRWKCCRYQGRTDNLRGDARAAYQSLFPAVQAPCGSEATEKF